MKFDKCPICCGRLQVTKVQEVWYDFSTFHVYQDGSRARIDASDLGEEHDPTGDGPTVVETRLYCENDHTDTQMLAAVSHV